MKLWLLEARDDLGDNDNPWKPWYDRTFGLVVRAETEAQAREIATNDEGEELRTNKQAWLLAKYSTCVELLADDEPGVILRHIRYA